MKTMAQTVRLCVFHRDSASILRIDKPCYPESQLLADDLATLCRRHIVVVAEEYGRIRGYCVYSREEDHFYILRLAVAPASYRRGLATLMVDRLIGMLMSPSGYRRDKIVALVGGRQMYAQYFFSAMGFRASPVPGTDTMRFVWEICE